MSGRSKLIDLGEEFPKLTEKERDVLIVIHPYLDGLSIRDAAVELGINVSSVQDRLRRVFKKAPWLQGDIARKRKEMSKQRRSIRFPARFGDMTCIGSDGVTDTFYDEKIVRKF